MNYQSTRGGLTALACALPLSRRPRSPWGTGRSPRMSGLLAVATVAIGALIGSAQALAQNAYVTNGGDNTVSVIATATNTVTSTINDPGFNGPDAVAVSPDGSKVYVTIASSGNVSVIATATDMVIGSPIPVGIDPLAFGVFIQPAKPAPRFAGTPGYSNCDGQSVSALAQQYRGLNAAAAALGFSDVSALQNAIMAFCE